ncbi:MAG: hypothetical protein V3T72_07080 [Thermoanaerobaculia bacterium]
MYLFVLGISWLAAAGCGEPEVEQQPRQEIPAAETPTAAASPQSPPPRARGKRAALRTLEVELASARLFDDRLEIELVFENTSESSVGLLGELEPGDFALAEDAGETLEPMLLTEALKFLDYGGGIKPGQRKTGGVAFPRPLGNSFELRVRGFEPLRFDWQHIVEAPGGPLLVDPGVEAEEEATGEEPDGEPAADESLPLVRYERPAVDELNRLLEEQAEAIASYDLDRYLATFAADRRDQERDVFLRLRSLPVTGVRMRVDRALGGDGRRALVELRFQLDGLPDDNPFVHAPTYTFVHDDGGRGGWQVAAIDDEEARPIPWRHGELAVHRSHHFLILTAPRMRRQLVAVAADAEAAYADLRRGGLPLASGYAVFFVADSDEFRTITRQANALGAALGRYVMDGDRVTVDSRAFYVNGPLFVGGRGPSLPAAARRMTVIHELVHLALAADTRPLTPPWLKEGVAVYFAGDLSFDANRSLVRRGLDHLDLEQMTRAPLGGHDSAQHQVADEYLFAGNVVAWLVERHGRERLLDLYRSYTQRRFSDVTSQVTALARPAALVGLLTDPRGALSVELTDDALDRRYGVDLTELEAVVKEWLRVPHG